MNIGLPPTNDNVLNETESKMASMWAQFFNQLITQLNTVFTNFGFFIPNITSAQKNTIASQYSRSITYDNDLSRMEINNTGSFEPIQTYSTKTTVEIQSLIQDQANIGKIYVNSETNSLQYSVDGSTIRTIVST